MFSAQDFFFTLSKALSECWVPFKGLNFGGVSNDYTFLIMIRLILAPFHMTK